MAANVTGMRVEETMVTGAAEKRGGVHRRRTGIVGLLAALLVAVVIGGAAMHERGVSHPALPAIPRVTTGAETRFLEENTITLPSAVGSETLAPARTGQGFTEQQVIEFDALTAIAAVVPSPVITAAEQRFLEANTILPVAAPASYMEQITPPPGQPR
jgi:hypothetical protein